MFKLAYYYKVPLYINMYKANLKMRRLKAWFQFYMHSLRAGYLFVHCRKI